jgi:hypothetical protein
MQACTKKAKKKVPLFLSRVHLKVRSWEASKIDIENGTACMLTRVANELRCQVKELFENFNWGITCSR